jgi:hypothetical protein
MKSSILNLKISLALSFAFLLSPLALISQDIQTLFNRSGLTSLTCSSDTTHANLLAGTFGSPVVKYRIGPGDWLDLYQDETRQKAEGMGKEKGERIKYEDYIEGMPLRMTQVFTVHDRYLDYQIELESMMEFPVTIGDLAVPFPWRTPGGEDPEYIFEQCFTKHHFIQGNGSFLYFTKPSGMPPYLLVTVLPGTSLEYFTSQGGYKAFIHSGLSAGLETRGSWRQPNTMLELGPKGSAGSKVSYGFRFQWASSFDQLRQLVYESGLFDIRVIPGMTIPSDLSARFSLHTKNKIDSITAEFPGATTIRFLQEFPEDHFQYEVSFRRPGENKLTIWWDHGKKTYLEFFSCEPLETLFKKRSSFIVNHQQHRDSTKWYNGLYSVFDMKEGILRGPDNTDGFDFWWGYVLACDDPALCKAPFVAAKNVAYPDPEEIASVEYYLKNFVWGKLQRTDQETPYPYGIYGTPNWMVNRDPLLRAGVKNRNLDKMNIWRSYDYPHIVMLYWHMYQIAKLYPDQVHYLDAAGYLERAYQTAKAYFTYPYEILPWYETYKWGCYNELVIVDLIGELEKQGESVKAKELRGEWEKKVKYFIYDDKYPFRSEYSLDRTAFESSYALAKYGVLNKMEPDTNLWFDKKLNKWHSHPSVKQEDAKEFMERQLMGGLAVRGWLEATYYLLGADFTSSSDGGSMSYMANMGGWGILDYGVRFSQKPDDWLQLGYASYLCHWALMNSGTPENNYGYWFPGKENDGASGWTFNNSKWGRAWIRKEVPRGPWHYDGEIDLGYGSSTRMARTILTKDSLFGWIAYGGTLTQKGKQFEVIPRDGLRTRFSAVLPDNRISIELNSNGFAKEQPISITEDFRKITFRLENRNPSTTKKTGVTEIRITCQPFRTPTLVAAGKTIKPVLSNQEWIFTVPIHTDTVNCTLTTH